MSAITPENVAESLTAGDNEYVEELDGWLGITAEDNVVRIKVTPARKTKWGAEGDDANAVHFRAVVYLAGEDDETPIVLERPVELGLPGDEGCDLISLTAKGEIRICPPDAAWFDLDPAEAREWAAQLAAMADAVEAVQKTEAVR